MKINHLACTLVSSLLLMAASAHAEEEVTVEKIAYPTVDEASFVLSVPSDWEMKQAEEAGDYFHLTTESGAVFSFRTIDGDEKALEGAIDRSLKQLNEEYTEVTLDEPKDWIPNGLTGFYTTGSAKEKEGGAPVRVGLGWCVLEDGKIAELWFVADEEDKDGISAAEDIANSLAAP